MAEKLNLFLPVLREIRSDGSRLTIMGTLLQSFSNFGLRIFLEEIVGVAG